MVPEQEHSRVSHINLGEEETPRVLVLDDAQNESEVVSSIMRLGAIGLEDMATYTQTIRCQHEELEHEDAVSASCAVWTKQLLPDRILTLTTRRGLKQMGLGDKDEGSTFRSKLYGLVLVIPPLWGINVHEYRSKVERMKREAGL